MTALRFVPIELPKDRETIIGFRRDSYLVSFGDEKDYPGDDEYVRWVSDRSSRFPEGFVLALDESGNIVGQIELQIKEHEGRRCGRINLYYLVQNRRGKGLGKELDGYAMGYFRKQGVEVCYLHVSASNGPAICFYRKVGFAEAAREEDGKVMRMEKRVPKM